MVPQRGAKLPRQMCTSVSNFLGAHQLVVAISCSFRDIDTTMTASIAQVSSYQKDDFEIYQRLPSNFDSSVGSVVLTFVVSIGIQNNVNNKRTIYR